MFEKLKDGFSYLGYIIKCEWMNLISIRTGWRFVTISVVFLSFLVCLHLFITYFHANKIVKEMIPFNTTESLEGSKDFDKAVNYVIGKTLFNPNSKDVDYLVFVDVVNNYGIIKLPEGESFYNTVKNYDKFKVLHEVQYRITDMNYPVTSTGIESELPDTVIVGDVGRESERGKYLPLTDYDHEQLKIMGIFLDEGYVYAKLSAGAETLYRAYYRSGDVGYLKDFIDTLPKHWYGVTDYYY